MEEFKDQLFLFIPLTTNLIIKLDNELSSIDEEIKMCKERIAMKKEVMKDDKIKCFLEDNLDSYKEISFNLSRFIGSIKEIDYEFRKFENESLEFKLKNYDLIGQQIDGYNEMNTYYTAGLQDLLDKIKESFALDEEKSRLDSITKSELDANIPVEVNELNKLKDHFNSLNENFNSLNRFLNAKQNILNNEQNQLIDKQTEFDCHSKRNEEKKVEMKTEHLKLVQLKSVIRKSIFEYLNKIKKLDELTKKKNSKIEQFRSLVRKYSKESVNDLNEKRSRLEQEIVELDKQLDDLQAQTHSNSSNKENNDFLKKFRTKKSKSKQLKVSLVDKLNLLEESYQKLIDKYDQQIELRD